MRKFTLALLALIAFTMTASAQEASDSSDDAAAPRIWLLETNTINYTELQYFTVQTDADRLDISGQGEAKLVNVATNASLTMTGYGIGYTMAMLETPTTIKALGQWKVSIPQGYYILTKGETEYPSPALEVTYNIAALEDFKILSMSPENGSTVNSLSEFMVTFNYPPMDCYEIFTVTNAMGDSICAAATTFLDANGNWHDDYRKMRFFFSDTIVDKGTYYIHIPDSTIKKQADSTPLPEIRLFFNVDGSLTSIESLPAVEELNAIYDLTGRRVQQITTPGVYIINGRKRLIK